MLTIRDEQLEALNAAKLQRFEERMAQYVAAEYPRRYASLMEEGTRRLIRNGIEFGTHHGIETEGALAVLIELMVEFGMQFERSPDRAWAERMLALSSIPGPIKVAAIRERFDERTGGRRILIVSPED